MTSKNIDLSSWNTLYKYKIFLNAQTENIQMQYTLIKPILTTLHPVSSPILCIIPLKTS